MKLYWLDVDEVELSCPCCGRVEGEDFFHICECCGANVCIVCTSTFEYCWNCHEQYRMPWE